MYYCAMKNLHLYHVIDALHTILLNVRVRAT